MKKIGTALTADPRRSMSSSEQLAVLRDVTRGRDFHKALSDVGSHPLLPTVIDTMQINVGKLCNQTCLHCHVDAGPDRREVMTRETMQQCLEALSQTTISTVDVTGGAPELNPNFRWLVEQCRHSDRHVIDRCNLTVLDLPSQADLPKFLAANQVEVVCSLPHYRERNTDRQRGDGVFAKSIKGLQRLNALGYGVSGSGLRLVLVANPVGAFLPAGQKSLEQEWKEELDRRHGIQFDALYTITNMPISRFLDWLIASTNLEQYMERLVTSFNPAAVAGLMCRNMLSIGWDGTIYDCDFNQMLDLPVASPAHHIGDFDSHALETREIVVDRHCFGCTAGAGSSCSGTTTTEPITRL